VYFHLWSLKCGKIKNEGWISFVFNFFSSEIRFQWHHPQGVNLQAWNNQHLYNCMLISLWNWISRFLSVEISENPWLFVVILKLSYPGFGEFMHPRLRKPNAQTAVRNCSRQPCLASAGESQVSTWVESVGLITYCLCNSSGFHIQRVLHPAKIFSGIYFVNYMLLTSFLVVRNIR